MFVELLRNRKEVYLIQVVFFSCSGGGVHFIEY